MPQHITFSLRYIGGLADEERIDFYDVSQALIGFERSLALTTHLILNGQVITKAPFLKGAEIFALPPQDGSWRITAVVVVTMLGGAYKFGTAPADTPVGHLVRSAYDYVISETLGFHVDYSKTLGQQYEELQRQGFKLPMLPRPRFDSLTEKCEVAIKEMHRPIVKSKSARGAEITSIVDTDEKTFDHILDSQTYEYIAHTDQSEFAIEMTGRVSSYNSNTYKGRVYIPDEGRPVPFELAQSARNPSSVARVTGSLSVNAQDSYDKRGDIEFLAFRNTSRSGQLKSILIVNVIRSVLH